MPNKRTYEYVKKVIEDTGCQLVSSEYESNKIPLEVIMRCGHKSMVRFNTFSSGSLTYVCRDCSDLAKCKNNSDDIKKFLKENGCEFISLNTKIISKKNTQVTYIGKCGHKTESNLNWMLSGDAKLQCELCNHKISDDTIKEFIENKKYKLINIERKKLDTIITYISTCKCTVTEKYSDLIKRTTDICTKCNGTYNYTIDDVREFLENKGCNLISDDYTKTTDYIEFIGECGHKTKKQFSEIKKRNNFKCSKCGPLKSLELEDIREYLNDIGCTLLSTVYKGIYDKIEYIGLCGHTVIKDFKGIQKGYGRYCTDCVSNESHGEKSVIEYCTNNDIIYVKQKKYDDCKNINRLPFDFHLPEHNLIIEFDGQDHFKQNGYRGGADKLISRKKNDNIKTEYCLKNNIKLLRISYSELKNIDGILEFIIENIDDINIVLVGKEYRLTKHYPTKKYEKLCTTYDKLNSFI